MNYLSVCSGIEAASVAWHPLGWRPFAFSEIEKFPSRVLAHHYPDTPNFGDMTKFQEWPDATIDVLVGGTPCQSFSVAGLRAGLADPRGNLMLTYLAIAGKYRPEWLVWENVPGVLSSNGGRDFGALLGGLAELGYGFAYRILDAQYVRVDGLGRAVPQRRRRVFVVGCLGDWRCAAAVLFERESLRWNSAPSRKAGEVVTGTISSRTTGGGGLGTDFDLAGGLQQWPADVATTLDAHFGDKLGLENQHVNGGAPCSLPPVSLCPNAGAMGRIDAESETLISIGGCFGGTYAIQSGALRENPSSGPQAIGVQSNVAYTIEARAEVQCVAHSLRADGFDASEDGIGRGTPIVPVAFDTYNQTVDCHVNQTLQRGTGTDQIGAVAFMDAPAVAYRTSGNAGVMEQGDRLAALNCQSDPNEHIIRMGMAVRRLTPRECERLQGFPDDYTAIPGAKDGPRYKALGNSMAVNVMRWIGTRIAMVDSISKARELAA